MKYLTNSGLSYFFNKMKTYISSVLPTKTSDLTNDSDFIDSNNLKTINNNSLVGTGNITITVNSVDWDNVNNKPSTFTPSTHTHAASDITSGTLNTDRIPNLDASKITSGTIDIARLPAGALERLVTVADQTARFNLTTNDVQLGDTVKQLDTGIMYYVIDTSNLNSESGYTEYTAGSATRVPWSGVTGKPSSYTPSSHTHSASDITSGLATVATSGSYNDLSNKPTIPTVNNATLTIQKNGTTVKTFTANASSNVTANITVPTKVSELTNDSGFITSDNTKIPLAGSNAISGSLIPSTDKTVNLGSGSYRFRQGCFGSVYATGLFGTPITGIDINYTIGANLILRGKDRPDEPGIFWLVADDGSSSSRLMGGPSGVLTWNNKNVAMAEDVIPRSGGAVMIGSEIGRTSNEKRLALRGGTDTSGGASIMVYGKDAASNNGAVVLGCYDGSNSKAMYMYPSGTWVWNGTACQITSDQRLKQQISQIDDALLDAWEDVELSQFKYNDAVDQKGDNARLHTGYVVQQIDEACKEHDVDISQYGLYCHEEYPQEVEEVEIEQADGTKVKERKVIREASEHYSLRYTETLVVECAYLRRENTRLKQQMKQYSESLNKLEERLKALEQTSK